MLDAQKKSAPTEMLTLGSESDKSVKTTKQSLHVVKMGEQVKL